MVPSDNNCVPIDNVAVEVVLQFTVVEGKGKMFLMHSADRYFSLPKQRRARFLNGDEGPRFTYPIRARVYGAQANVYTKLAIDPQSGRIIDLKIAHIITAKGWEAEFSRAIERTLANTQFVPMPEYSRPVNVCIPFVFRFSD